MIPYSFFPPKLPQGQLDFSLGKENANLGNDKLLVLIKVIYGLAISTVLGFGLGFFVTKIIQKICKNIEKKHCVIY